MNDRDLMFTSATEQRALVAGGRSSSRELTQASLRRVAELEPQLNAFITVDEEGALAAADAADKAVARGDDLGLLHGVPISIKDLELTRGLRTTLGSVIYQDWIPDQDSVVVERVRRAGAVIIGKTNTPEFGNREETFTRIHPACNNPWDTTRMPGGSSGGAAASVASGMCAIATGTDGGGSVRLPAAMCGIFGHKPTHGRIPRAGGVARPAANQTSTSGPLSRTVRDSAVMMSALAGHDRRDPGSLRTPPPDYLSQLESGVSGMRIGVSLDLGFAALEPEVAGAVQRASAVFESLGAHVEEAGLALNPVPRDYWWTIWCGNQKAMYGHLEADRADDLMPYTLEMIRHGATLTGADYSLALRQADMLHLQMAELFERIDLLILPSTAATAWPHLDPPNEIGQKATGPSLGGIQYGAIPFTMAFNISWNPAASVPCGFDSLGLPIGLQVVGDLNDDSTVLRACYAYEQATHWVDRRPPVS